ncbi:MAG: 50S ribosomal protein L18 [Oscillospiraceae bacterium]|jgi:large subunit ribosomal protein L18|nr:50S ribosomal protein L18 [Oscillospiraceae bacterium]
MVSKKSSNIARKRRQTRVRGKIQGTAARPRLNVFRSLEHIYAQLIDDTAGVTLAAAASTEKEFEAYGGNKAAARKIGELIAARAIQKGISEVVFDRAGYVYHGRVQELAEGARAGGLKF